MSKTQPFSMRMRAELKDALQALADADRRSLTNYIEIVLEDHVTSTKAAKPLPRPKGKQDS